MPYGTVNADVIQTSTTGGILGAGNASIMKNRLINSAMVIDQRNAGASVTPTDGQYLVDRWCGRLTQASKFSAQQNAGSVTPPVGFVNYLGATSLSAYTVVTGDFFLLRQIIEGYNIADLGWGTANAKTVTISFWVRSSLTGTFGGSITNASNNRAYPFSYTINSANTWEYETITIAGDTSGTWNTTNSAGFNVNFSLGSGATYSGTAGAWSASNLFSATGATSVVGTNGATFYITGVQLEVGSSATGYEYENYTSLLAKCQRYYCKSFEQNIVPAASATIAFGTTLTPYSASTFYVSGIYKYPVQMRAAPTVVFYTVNSGSSANAWDFFAGGSWTAFSTTALIANSSSQLSAYGVGSGLTNFASYLVAGNFTASSEL